MRRNANFAFVQVYRRLDVQADDSRRASQEGVAEQQRSRDLLNLLPSWERNKLVPPAGHVRACGVLEELGANLVLEQEAVGQVEEISGSEVLFQGVCALVFSTCVELGWKLTLPARYFCLLRMRS